MQGVIYEMGDDVMKAKITNPEGEEVGSVESRVEGNKFHSVRFKALFTRVHVFISGTFDLFNVFSFGKISSKRYGLFQSCNKHSKFMRDHYSYMKCAPLLESSIILLFFRQQN